MARREKIIMFGGGGHARVLIEILRLNEEYEVVGILDPILEAGIDILGIPVLGTDDMIAKLRRKGIQHACIGVGTVRTNTIRRTLYEKAREAGFNLPTVVHPRAIVSESAQLSEGVQVMAGAVIQRGVLIGENTIVNTGAIIDHDCNIGKHVHICPGVIISGGCMIGDDVFIGAGATIIHAITIGKASTIGAGSVVIKNISPGETVKGISARG